MNFGKSAETSFMEMRTDLIKTLVPSYSLIFINVLIEVLDN